MCDREASVVIRSGPLKGRHTMKRKCDCGNHMEHGTYIYQDAISGWNSTFLKFLRYVRHRVIKIKINSVPSFLSPHYFQLSYPRYCNRSTTVTAPTAQFFIAPCSIVLQKLTGLQLVKKFPTFYGTQRRFITSFTSGRHLSLSWASSIQFKPSHPTSGRSILILSSHRSLGLPSCLFPSGFPTKTLYTPLLSPYALYVRPSNFSRFYHQNNIAWVQIIKVLINNNNNNNNNNALLANIFVLH